MIIKGKDAINDKMAQIQKENSDYFKLEPDESTVIRFITDIDDSVAQENHFVDKQRLACRADEGICPCCESPDPEIRRKAFSVWYLVYDYTAKKVKVWTANAKTHKKIVIKADVYGTLIDRDFHILGEEAGSGKYKHVAYDLTPKDKSDAPEHGEVKLNLETLLKAREVSEEKMEAALNGEDVSK